MTVHLIAPSPHSETTHRFDVDAFAAKCRRLGTMLTSQGYKVILYGGPENESDVFEHVPLVTREEQLNWFGNFDPMVDIFNTFDVDHPAWVAFNARAILEIQKRVEPQDILGLSMGLAHKPIADAFPALLAVETGIGYPGVFAPYRVFESYAWAHYLAKPDDVRLFDTVIPNSYDDEEFPLGSGQGGYHLFMGRFIKRKGIEIAVEATKRLGVELIMAGPGVLESDDNTYRGVDLTVSGDHIRHIGSVTGPAKAKLMGDAEVVWMPTTYLEPFGSVATESMTTGTPVIATDWGAFTETIAHGLSGYRCRTLRQFVEAGEAAKTLDRAAVREYARSKYSTAVVAPQYDRYFKQLSTLYGEGWYFLPDGRSITNETPA